MKQGTMLAVCGLMIWWCGAAADFPEGINVFFNDASHSDGAALKASVLDMFDEARESIDVCVYHFDYRTYLDALCAAAQRIGVENVRVIVDHDYADEALAVLEPCGIEVRDDADGPDPSGRIVHDKFIIIDGQSLWNGSANFTAHGITSQNNNAVRIDNAAIAMCYKQEFEEMWAGRFGAEKAPHEEHDFTVGGAQISCYFSPSPAGEVEAAILAEIEAARRDITFSIYYYTLRSVSDALLGAISHYNVSVIGVMDQEGADSYSSEFTYLKNNGIAIRKHNEPCPHADLLHHKFMVLDRVALSYEPVVITGSSNWTRSGCVDSHDENIMIIHNRAVAEAYYAEFVKNYYGTNEEEEPELTLALNGIGFNAGQRLILDAVMQNTCLYRTVFLYAALNVGTDDYWFAPSWRHYPPSLDHLSITLIGGGSVTTETVLDAVMPDPLPPGGPFFFYGAMLDDASGELLGDLQVVEFSLF
ncbi:hypothetical protein JW905_15555 [bacterium]|nr:hypothetical protein [candidate division CSSED10-310 bacterium]